MKTARRLLVFFSLTLALSFFTATELHGQYHFDSWTTDDGLPQNGIREIAQAPNGYLWFTTFDGLVRFDGVRFTTFSKGNTQGIINNRFTSLYCDQNGVLYAATTEEGVLTIYNQGKFRSYTAAEVPGDYIKAIKPDLKGEVRFLIYDNSRNAKDWYYLRNDKFVFAERQKTLDSIIEFRGNSGALWKTTRTDTTELRNGRTTHYSHNFELFDSTLEVFEDRAGGLWIGGTVLTYLKDGKTESLGKNAGFPNDANFHTFWEEKDGSVWFANGGVSGPGLGLVRFKDGKFEHFGKEHGLSNGRIFDVFRDRESNIWLATDKGLNRLQKDVISAYSVKDGLKSAEVYPLFRDSNNTIWIGSVKGLSAYRNGKFETVNLRQKNNDVPAHTKWVENRMAVQSIFEDSNGKLWVGVAGGIFIVENGEALTLTEAESYHVFSFAEDSDGNVWAATSKGILKFSNYRLSRRLTVSEGLPSNYMTVVFKDKVGRLWFGGSGGLSELKDGKLRNLTVKEGLTGNYVRTIYEDKEGILWIGTYDEGLSRYKDGKFTNFKATDGLHNNGVFAIEEDRYENFWISSNSGIYRVKRSQLNDFADGKTSRINSTGYARADGMLSSECNGGRQPASLRDENGHFWFPTQDGVVVVNPDIEALNLQAPSVVIESATVEREPVDISNGLTIEAGQKNIEIRFTGISLIKSEQVKFKYKLEGHDTEWIDSETRRTAYYSNLAPGQYTFKVKAANSDGIWNDTGASIAVELKPFFYQTNWFYLMCATILVLGLAAAWKLSVQQLEYREKRLAKLVEKKTEELGLANQELLHLANSDGLTAIGNRRRFEDFLADEWHRGIRFKTEISLVLIDIDHFKLYNDAYGHLAGDEALKKVAQALQQTIHRPTDLVARFGGEEFAIVLGGTDSPGALLIARQAVENIKRLMIVHEESLTDPFLTVSVGVATTFATLGSDESELIHTADQALYKAKETGRDRIRHLDLTIDLEDAESLEKELLTMV